MKNLFNVKKHLIVFVNKELILDNPGYRISNNLENLKEYILNNLGLSEEKSSFLFSIEDEYGISTIISTSNYERLITNPKIMKIICEIEMDNKEENREIDYSQNQIQEDIMDFPDDNLMPAPNINVHRPINRKRKKSIDNIPLGINNFDIINRINLGSKYRQKKRSERANIIKNKEEQILKNINFNEQNIHLVNSDKKNNNGEIRINNEDKINDFFILQKDNKENRINIDENKIKNRLEFQQLEKINNNIRGKSLDIAKRAVEKKESFRMSQNKVNESVERLGKKMLYFIIYLKNENLNKFEVLVYENGNILNSKKLFSWEENVLKGKLSFNFLFSIFVVEYIPNNNCEIIIESNLLYGKKNLNSSKKLSLPSKLKSNYFHFSPIKLAGIGYTQDVPLPIAKIIASYMNNVKELNFDPKNKNKNLDIKIDFLYYIIDNKLYEDIPLFGVVNPLFFGKVKKNIDLTSLNYKELMYTINNDNNNSLEVEQKEKLCHIIAINYFNYFIEHSNVEDYENILINTENYFFELFINNLKNIINGINNNNIKKKIFSILLQKSRNTNDIEIIFSIQKKDSINFLELLSQNLNYILNKELIGIISLPKPTIKDDLDLIQQYINKILEVEGDNDYINFFDFISDLIEIHQKNLENFNKIYSIIQSLALHGRDIENLSKKYNIIYDGIIKNLFQKKKLSFLEILNFIINKHLFYLDDRYFAYRDPFIFKDINIYCEDNEAYNIFKNNKIWLKFKNDNYENKNWKNFIEVFLNKPELLNIETFGKVFELFSDNAFDETFSIALKNKFLNIKYIYNEKNVNLYVNNSYKILLLLVNNNKIEAMNFFKEILEKSKAKFDSKLILYIIHKENNELNNTIIDIILRTFINGNNNNYEMLFFFIKNTTSKYFLEKIFGNIKDKIININDFMEETINFKLFKLIVTEKFDLVKNTDYFKNSVDAAKIIMKNIYYNFSYIFFEKYFNNQEKKNAFVDKIKLLSFGNISEAEEFYKKFNINFLKCKEKLEQIESVSNYLKSYYDEMKKCESQSVKLKKSSIKDILSFNILNTCNNFEQLIKECKNSDGISNEFKKEKFEYEKKLADLTKQLEEKKNKIEELNKQIKEKDFSLSQQELDLKLLEKKLNNLSLERINYRRSEDEEMLRKQLKFNEDLIMEKNKKIDDLCKELYLLRNIGNNKDLEKNSLGSNPIEVHFISSNQKINVRLTIDESASFSRLEELLYEKYPLYKESDNYFLVDGNKIKRFKTLKENKITEQGKKILLINQEEEIEKNKIK